MKTLIKYGSMAFTGLFCLAMAGCQKMERPALGDFPRDANPPGGTLNFYVAFDGTTSDPRRNAVDSIRANFASENPLASVDGIRGKAVQGENKKFIRYAKPNDWAVSSASFTIAFWFKQNGQTLNNTGGNGPAHVLTFKSDNNHWSGSSMLVFLEGNNTAGQVKVMTVDRTNADNWFTWEGGNSIPGLFNNAWHHAALVYNATTSTMTLYIDGVANPNTRRWANHGGINFDNNKIQQVRVGGGPNDAVDSDDWLASTYKGQLDQLRLYSAALSAAEVQALFNGKM